MWHTPRRWKEKERERVKKKELWTSNEETWERKFERKDGVAVVWLADLQRAFTWPGCRCTFRYLTAEKKRGKRKRDEKRKKKKTSRKVVVERWGVGCVVPRERPRLSRLGIWSVSGIPRPIQSAKRVPSPFLPR